MDIDELKAALEGRTKKEKLDALCDGNFLSVYDVTEEEVEDLYNTINEGI
jgi:hypothetical protein